MKRYIITVQFYQWNESDDKAKEEAEETAKKLRDKKDNDAEVIEIGEREFGSFNYRIVYKKVIVGG